MFTLLQAAEATQAPAQQGFGNMSFWIMIGAMILIMYFFMIRPQQKARKKEQEMRDALKAGDKVITAGGIHAKIKELDGDTVLIEVDSNVTLRVNKNMIFPVSAVENK